MTEANENDADPTEVAAADVESKAEPQNENAEEQPLSIRLDQFLQLCGVPTGGQAKLLIQGGEVMLNGEVETRRRKKLVVGDSVELDGEVYEVGVE